MKEVDLYTDGACSNNTKDNGPGGWGSILVFGEVEKELSGGSSATTNNKMELQAVIEGLKVLKEPCIVNLYSDSKYVLNGIHNWLSGWVKNDWKNSSNKSVKNIDEWKEYLSVSEGHIIRGNWIKGHSGHPMNERCDQLAVIQRDEFKET